MNNAVHGIMNYKHSNKEKYKKHTHTHIHIHTKYMDKQENERVVSVCAHKYWLHLMAIFIVKLQNANYEKLSFGKKNKINKCITSIDMRMCM